MEESSGDAVRAATASENAEDTKPDPELLEVAVDRVDGSSSIVVGDAVWDVEATHRLGCPGRGAAQRRQRLDTVLTPLA